MAPSLREKRVPSGKAVAASQQSETPAPAKGTAGRSSIRRSNSQPKSVSFRSKKAPRSKSKTSTTRDRTSSTSGEDSPSQGRGDSQSRPPPSAQRTTATQSGDEQGEGEGDEEDEATSDPERVTLEEVQETPFPIRYDVFVGKEWQFCEYTSSEKVDLYPFQLKAEEQLNTKLVKRREKAVEPAFGPIVTITAGRRERKLKLKKNIAQVINPDHQRPIHDVLYKVWALRKFEKWTIHEIEVIIRWDFTSTPLIDEDSVSTSAEEDEDSTQTRRRRSSSKKRKRKDRLSASQRQRNDNVPNQQIEEITGNYYLELNRIHTCRVTSCRNYGKPCVVLSGQPHLILNSNALKKWNQLIRDGDATTRECPGTVVFDLLQEQQRYETKKLGGKPQHGMGMNVGPGHNINYYFGPGGGGVALAGTQLQEVTRSSPPEREGDDDKNMTLYIEWLERKYPVQSFELGICGQKLASHGWGYSDLREITDDGWQRMDINGGFVKKIRKHIKDWTGPTVEGGDGVGGIDNVTE